MYTLPVPCELAVPSRDPELFDPGAVFTQPSGVELARVRIPEKTRYKGFWRWTGQVYEPFNLDLVIVTPDGRQHGTLRVRKPGMFRRATFTLLDGDEAGCGSLRIVASSVRVPVSRDTIHVLDAAGTEVGRVEHESGFTGVTLRLFDHGTGGEYGIYDPPPRPGDQGQFLGLPTVRTDRCEIRSDNADRIDARVVLAWVYYQRIYQQMDS